MKKSHFCVVILFLLGVLTLLWLGTKEMMQQAEALHVQRLDECREKGGVLVEHYRSTPICYPKGVLIPLSK